MSGRRPREYGFTLIELLIVIIIVGILAAIAIPMYVGQRDKAKLATLQNNARYVCIAALTYACDDSLAVPSSAPQNTPMTYMRNAGTPGGAAYKLAATQYVSNALEAGLEEGVSENNTDHYINPYSGKKTIVNWGSVLVQPYTPPAVFITNASSCRYASFSAAGNANLRGSVIACWNTATGIGAIQIYYVKGDGKKGPLLYSIPLAR
jgi:prepilin-type N-terminal cleavage/methylation domain-containing protein